MWDNIRCSSLWVRTVPLPNKAKWDLYTYFSRSPDSTNFWFIEADSWLSFILLKETKPGSETQQKTFNASRKQPDILTRPSFQTIYCFLRHVTHTRKCDFASGSPQEFNFIGKIQFYTRYLRVTPKSMGKGVSSHVKPDYMEKSCPGQEGHPLSPVNFSERLCDNKFDRFDRVKLKAGRLGEQKCLYGEKLARLGGWPHNRKRVTQLSGSPF